MSTLEQAAQPLISGERLARVEFLRRWEQLPSLKRAELIGGIVYMPSPLSAIHGSAEVLACVWLGNYAIHTAGCSAGSQGTWFMLEDVPQPDAFLMIRPEYGGQSTLDRKYGRYSEGAPELIAEVCVSSAAYDLGPKLELYERAGVREYVAIVLRESKVIWHRLPGGTFSIIDPDPDGFFRSSVFPGLWLDPAAFLKNDGARVLDALNRGLQSPQHEEFERTLASRCTA